MEREATEEMLRYTAEVCGKYREIKMLAEEAEAAWKQSLACWLMLKIRTVNTNSFNKTLCKNIIIIHIV